MSHFGRHRRTWGGADGSGQDVSLVKPETIADRALDLAHEYLIAMLDGRKATRAQEEKPEDELFAAVSIAEADEWLAEREREWAANGRLNALGFLCAPDPAAPWTLDAIRRCFPKADALACLITLNGVIEESDMKEIVALIRRIVREEVQLVFSESIAEARETRSPLWGGRARDGAARRARRRTEGAQEARAHARTE